MNKKIAVWLLLCLIWGSTWLFIKMGLRDLPPISFAGMRFSTSAAILWLIAVAGRRPIPRGGVHWWPIFWSGVLGFGLNYSLIFWGEQYISSGMAAVLQAMTPVFGLFLAHYFLANERITVGRVAGVVAGISGVALIFSNQLKLEGRAAVAGSAAIVASAFFVACSNVIIKARGRGVDPIVISAAQMTIGTVPLMIIGYFVEGNPANFGWTGRAAGSLLYLVLIGGVIPFVAYYWLIKHMEVTKTMLISLVTPVVAVFLGIVTLGEVLSWRTAAGTLLIIGGVGFVLGKQVFKRTQRFRGSSA